MNSDRGYASLWFVLLIGVRMQMLWELESSLYTHLFEIKSTQRREDELREVSVGGKVKEDVKSGGLLFT